MEQSDKSAVNEARSAAYTYDGRAPGWAPAATEQGDDWHPCLAALLNAGYIFLQQGYAGGGMLFRGMGCGLLEALAKRSFWHFSSSRPLADLERELNVIFCSEHAGDALAAARPWEPRTGDAGLLLFSSDIYRYRSRQRAAAMLALADPGMVFKYPLLTDPLYWDDIDVILVSKETLQRCRAAVAGEPVAGLDETACRDLQRLAGQGLFDKLQEVAVRDRAGWANAVDDCLQQRQCQPARLVTATEWPQRRTPREL